MILDLFVRSKGLVHRDGNMIMMMKANEVKLNSNATSDRTITKNRLSSHRMRPAEGRYCILIACQQRVIAATSVAYTSNIAYV